MRNQESTSQPPAAGRRIREGGVSGSQSGPWEEEEVQPRTEAAGRARFPGGPPQGTVPASQKQHCLRLRSRPGGEPPELPLGDKRVGVLAPEPRRPQPPEPERVQHVRRLIESGTLH